MTKELGMTASFPENLSSSDFEKKPHPSKFFYYEMLNKKDEDFLCCLQKLQYHKCSGFCMQKRCVL